MSSLSAIPRLWRSQSITVKFAVAFSMLLALLLLEALVGYAGLQVSQRAEAEILASVEIRQRVFEMDGELEKARRLHRDFLLKYPEIGFAKAHEEYFLPAKAVIARVVAISDDLRQRMAASGVSAALRGRNKDISLYLSTAQRFEKIFEELVGVVTVLAAPGAGLLDQLGRLDAALESRLRASGEAHQLFLVMGRHANEYLITRQRPHMQQALNTAFLLERGLNSAPGLSPGQQDEARRLLRDYVAVAGRIPDIDVQIRGRFNDFALQAQAVDPISRDLKALAALEVERARGRIHRASRLATAAIIATALTGLGFALAVAVLIHASVTRKIVALNQTAEELRAGDLNARSLVRSGDELGVLAMTFNDMAAQVQHLVGNLEGNVQLRTEELAFANDKLEQAVRELDGKNQALEVMTRTDGLTGLANRRRLEESLLTEVLRARRYGKPFSIILLDLDKFKSINDIYGHQAGDNVLIAISGLLTRTARETDVVGRWGGEEFLLVCPETDLQVVSALAERLRMELLTADFIQVGRVTASFGVAQFSQGDSMETLVRQADEALYRAKGGGRNRVEVGAAETS
ncbi:MAG: diguanylate cyclase [Proteobacteria bacterium]|nr:diguanylate cyclase [Pseudomonadota bacterium]MBU1595338.1 diguanylate cyclase [Pseudomonadota bacterium]